MFGTRGDSFLVAFGDPDAAVLAAVDAQLAITDATWPGERAVRIRVGLHTGYARCVDGDYHALSINQAARIVDTANGGQTFATDSVVALQSDRVSGVWFEPLGRYRVRDFDGPVQLHSVRASGMPEVDSAPRVRPAEGHNMVRPTTVLVGRERDVASTVAATAAAGAHDDRRPGRGRQDPTGPRGGDGCGHRLAGRSLVRRSDLSGFG